jgi:hypothetical protein
MISSLPLSAPSKIPKKPSSDVTPRPSDRPPASRAAPAPQSHDQYIAETNKATGDTPIPADKKGLDQLICLIQNDGLRHLEGFAPSENTANASGRQHRRA